MADVIQAPAKKVRNHEIDFWKAICCILVLVFHANQFVYGANNPVFPNGYFGYADLLFDESGFMPKGIFTLGFFYFTTGYWLMDAFQKYKRSGMLHQGHDFEAIYRMTAKNYAAYAPICFVATVICFAYGHIIKASSLETIIRSAVNAIWEFLGVNGLGMFMVNGKNASNAMLVLFSPDAVFDPNVVYNYVTITWYMTALMCFCSIFFALLVINEKLMVFGVAPILLSTAFITYDSAELIGLRALLPTDFIKLWGPAMFGLVAWYAVNAIKQLKWSDKAKKIVGWIHCIMFVATFVMLAFGYLGGMLNFDVWLSIIVALSLIGKDWFTEKFNALFEKLPFITKHIGNVSLGIFALQAITLPMATMLAREGLVEPGYQSYLLAIGLGVGCGIIWAIVAPPITKSLTKFLTKIFGLKTPFGSMTLINDIEAN